MSEPLTAERLAEIEGWLIDRSNAIAAGRAGRDGLGAYRAASSKLAEAVPELLARIAELEAEVAQAKRNAAGYRREWQTARSGEWMP